MALVYWCGRVWKQCCEKKSTWFQATVKPVTFKMRLTHGDFRQRFVIMEQTNKKFCEAHVSSYAQRFYFFVNIIIETLNHSSNAHVVRRWVIAPESAGCWSLQWINNSSALVSLNSALIIYPKELCKHPVALAFYGVASSFIFLSARNQKFHSTRRINRKVPT